MDHKYVKCKKILVNKKTCLWIKLVRCSDCGKEVDKREALQLIVNKQKHYFHLTHVTKLSQRNLSQVVLSKTFAEIIAIATGMIGIFYTLQDFSQSALLMDTLSAIAAIGAMFVGIEHLQYLKEHDLLRRAVTLIGTGILMAIIILVWHFGFRLD